MVEAPITAEDLAQYFSHSLRVVPHNFLFQLRDAMGDHPLRHGYMDPRRVEEVEEARRAQDRDLRAMTEENEGAPPTSDAVWYATMARWHVLRSACDWLTPIDHDPARLAIHTANLCATARGYHAAGILLAYDPPYGEAHIDAALAVGRLLEQSRQRDILRRLVRRDALARGAVL